MDRYIALARQKGAQIVSSPLTFGLAAVTFGTASTSLAVWEVCSFLLRVTSFPIVAATSLVMLCVGFFTSVFAGVDIMDAVESQQPVSIARLRRSVAAGFVDLFRV